MVYCLGRQRLRWQVHGAYSPLSHLFYRVLSTTLYDVVLNASRSVHTHTHSNILPITLQLRACVERKTKSTYDTIFHKRIFVSFSYIIKYIIIKIIIIYHSRRHCVCFYCAFPAAPCSVHTKTYCYDCTRFDTLDFHLFPDPWRYNLYYLSREIYINCYNNICLMFILYTYTPNLLLLINIVLYKVIQQAY